MIEAIFAAALVLVLAVVAWGSYGAGYSVRDREAREDRDAEVAKAFELGWQTGEDDLANAWLAAEADRDPFDVWPAERPQERRPS